MTSTLRSRIRSGDGLIGTFIKTPTPHNVEILGHAGLDFAVIDQEHAPIDLAHLDVLALASRAVGLPLLARRWGEHRDWIGPALDVGLDGVLVPHVRNGAEAEEVCDAVRFARGKRGLSPSPRAGNYGSMTISAYRAASDARNVAVVQIEDAQALGRLDEIASVDDIDMIFVGPADLSQSLGVDLPSPDLDEAIGKIIAAGKRNRKAIGLFVNDAGQIPAWRERGVSLFVCASDQALLHRSASELVRVARG